MDNVLRIDVFSKYLILHKATKQSAVASPDFFADFRFLLILDFCMVQLECERRSELCVSL